MHGSTWWCQIAPDHFSKEGIHGSSRRPQQGDLRLSGPPSGQGAGIGARTRDRRVPADLRADSQATVLPTPRKPRASLFY
ncbi:hypothetical protein PoB_002865300 [Plakobranchus ocellatus]|uniref:Uncharacterized protein n=1 Tax=Plakobranchus ocellatus TaxID=259542 RepID=A0AAV4A601_9GAST|nr:hypothetical protein PoB_002865300 [Plakobranchus ocellatus]